MRHEALVPTGVLLAGCTVAPTSSLGLVLFRFQRR
jgi:hypothetical protein